jgi:hypothetical protein
MTQNNDFFILILSFQSFPNDGSAVSRRFAAEMNLLSIWDKVKGKSVDVYYRAQDRHFTPTAEPSSVRL